MNSPSFRFGTVGAPISTPPRPGGSVSAARRIAALGLGALELGWVRSVRVSEATCLAIKQAAEAADVLISVHAPYYINLNGSTEEWPNSRRRLMDAAIFGHLAGATEIIFHPGAYLGLSPDAVLEIAIERLRGCVLELRANGNPVTLRPETMGKAGQLGSFSECLAMSTAIDGVQPCLDFAHLHARAGDGSMNSYTEWKALLEQYRQALGQAALQNLSCHLSGIAYSLKGERYHLPMKESDFKLGDLLKALHDTGCAGRLLCESPIMEADALYFQQSWMAIEAETIP
jgi:deoxyribonuclease-4